MVKKKILFVCTGNICRSPGAEAVFTEMVKKEGLIKNFEIGSAGTTSYHVGQPADKRMKFHAIKRGYNLTSISRKFNPASDFSHFDLIIGMDNEHITDLKALAQNESQMEKIHIITEFSKNWDYGEVPDPYYGGEEGFELVLDLLEDGCQGLLEKLIKK